MMPRPAPPLLRHQYGPAEIDRDEGVWFFSEVCSVCGVLRHSTHEVGAGRPDYVVWFPDGWGDNDEFSDPLVLEPPCPASLHQVFAERPVVVEKKKAPDPHGDEG